MRFAVQATVIDSLATGRHQLFCGLEIIFARRLSVALYLITMATALFSVRVNRQLLSPLSGGYIDNSSIDRSPSRVRGEAHDNAAKESVSSLIGGQLSA